MTENEMAQPCTNCILKSQHFLCELGVIHQPPLSYIKRIHLFIGLIETKRLYILVFLTLLYHH